MIRKIQRKFVIIAAAVIFAVVALTLTVINVTNYVHTDKGLTAKINFIIDNGGKLPGKFNKNDLENLPENPNLDDGEKVKLPGGFSPEMPYETRYFTVLITESGEPIANLDYIAAIGQDDAINYAKKLYNKGDTSGYYNDYKYQATTLTMDNKTGTLYVFLDATRELNSVRNFLLVSVSVGAAGVVIVSLLILLLSRLAIRPFVDNYQKQKQFITDASHELKTPLTVIKASTEVLEIEQGHNEWTNSINQEITKLTNLTNKLVILAKADEMERPVNNSEFSLSNTVQEIIEPFEKLAKAQKQDFQFNIQPDLTLNGDVSAIGQLINILLDNAFKYVTPKGQIRLSLSGNAHSKKISIANTADLTGYDNLDRLFDRFYRPDQSRNSDKGGFGIGLSVAKAIVNAHKGKIRVHRLNEYTIEFVVNL